MQILDKAVYVGPSLYAHFPVIRLDIDLGPLEEWPSGKLGPRFTDALLAALPGLKTHTCSYGKPGGFVRRLTEGEGTWMGHILEHVAIELQNVAGETVTFGKTRSHGPVGHYYVIYQYEQEEVGVEAGRLGLTLLHSLLPRRAPAARAAVPVGVRLCGRAGRVHPLCPAAGAGAQHHGAGAGRRGAADSLDPAQRPEPDPIRPRPLPAADPGHRHQPHLPHRGGAGLRQGRDQPDPGQPRPAGAPAAAGAERRTMRSAAAERIGYPVVVKPYNANHGRGISIHLTTAEQVRAAFDVAREHSRSVIVESFISGEDHRMLVINGELVAVAKRVPGPRGGRRDPHHRAAGGRGEPGPPAGRGPREGAHPAAVRSSGGEPAVREGLYQGDGPGHAASGCSSAPPGISPPAAPPPT